MDIVRVACGRRRDSAIPDAQDLGGDGNGDLRRLLARNAVDTDRTDKAVEHVLSHALLSVALLEAATLGQ
jgi:hypothetical protein